MKSIKLFIMSMFVAMLTACGGSSYAGTNCNLPYEIVFERNSQGVLAQHRKATVNDPYVLFATGADATRAFFDCPGTTTQFIEFNKQTTNFYSGQGDHFAVLMNATFQLTQYSARGAIFHRNWGVLGEKYALNVGLTQSVECKTGTLAYKTCLPSDLAVCPCNKPHDMVVQDTVPYYFVMESIPGNIAYNAVNLQTGQAASSAWNEQYQHSYENGSQVGFAVLLDGSPAVPFNIRIWNLTAGRR